MDENEVIGYWVRRTRDKPYECVICLDCWETQATTLVRRQAITFGWASAQDEPPLCVECGLYLPTRGEP